MSKHKPQFSIQRTEEFIQKCNELSKVYGRMVDLINAIDWALERMPHLYTQITTDYYLLKTGQLSNPNFPKLKIMYKIIASENKVILIDIDDEV